MKNGAYWKKRFKQIDENTIEGYVITEPEYVKKYQAGASVAMYFYAKLDRAPESVEVFYQDSALTARNEIKGPGAWRTAGCNELHRASSAYGHHFDQP